MNIFFSKNSNPLCHIWWRRGRRREKKMERIGVVYMVGMRKKRN